MIVPCLFAEPSTLNTGRGLSSSCDPRLSLFTVLISMKLSVAPVSSNAVSWDVPLKCRSSNGT